MLDEHVPKTGTAAKTPSAMGARPLQAVLPQLKCSFRPSVPFSGTISICFPDLRATSQKGGDTSHEVNDLRFLAASSSSKPPLVDQGMC